MRQGQLEQPVAQEDGLLGAIEHAEVGREADLERVLAQDPITEGVERRDLDVGVAVWDERVDALLHLGGGLVGEGEREDLVGPSPARDDEPGDAPRDDGGLAGPGAGDDQQWPGIVRDGPPLRLVEPLEDAVSRHARSHYTSLRPKDSLRRAAARTGGHADVEMATLDHQRVTAPRRLAGTARAASTRPSRTPRARP